VQNCGVRQACAALHCSAIKLTLYLVSVKLKCEPLIGLGKTMSKCVHNFVFVAVVCWAMRSLTWTVMSYTSVPRTTVSHVMTGW